MTAVNHSIEYIAERIVDESIKDMFNVEQFRKCAMVVPPFTVLHDDWKKCQISNSMLECIVGGQTIDGHQSGETKITIEYAPQTNFSWFIADKCVHDGTLSFVLDGCNRIFSQLLNLAYFRENAATPADYENNIWAYDVKYTIGDFVVAFDINEQYAPANKPWMRERQIIALPITSVEYFKH